MGTLQAYSEAFANKKSTSEQEKSGTKTAFVPGYLIFDSRWKADQTQALTY